MEPIRSPFSDSLATGHWYNSDGSLSDIYRERLLKRGRSIAEIEELDETARREFQIRQEWRDCYFRRISGNSINVTPEINFPLK